MRHVSRRVVELLLPGENVLQALRRLAAVRQPAAAALAAGSASSGGGSPATDVLASNAGPARGPAMPPAVREKFEQLVRRAGGLGGRCMGWLCLTALKPPGAQPACLNANL